MHRFAFFCQILAAENFFYRPTSHFTGLCIFIDDRKTFEAR
jgi:hypothetical protein